MERLEAYKIAQKCAQLLKEQFKVNNVYIFGSVAGDGLWHKWSDIDIAVEGLPSKDYFKALVALDKFLTDGLDIDLVTLEDAPERLRERVKSLSGYLEENEGILRFSEISFERLKWLIESELQDLEQLSSEIDKFLSQVSNRIPNVMELMGVGGILQFFYNGIEQIFKRINLTLTGELPQGEDWHTSLLQQVEAGQIIDQSLAIRLLEYLTFRHRFWNSYGHIYEWDKIRPLAENVSDTLKAFREQINNFLENS